MYACKFMPSNTTAKICTDIHMFILAHQMYLCTNSVRTFTSPGLRHSTLCVGLANYTFSFGSSRYVRACRCAYFCVFSKLVEYSCNYYSPCGRQNTLRAQCTAQALLAHCRRSFSGSLRVRRSCMMVGEGDMAWHGRQAFALNFSYQHKMFPGGFSAFQLLYSNDKRCACQCE